MYVGVRKYTFEKEIPVECILTLRKNTKKLPISIGQSFEDKKSFVIAHLDLPKIPWYMVGSPALVFMQNSLITDEMSKEIGEAIHKAFDGFIEENNIKQLHYSDLGIDHTNLHYDNEALKMYTNAKNEFAWGKDFKKVQKFQKDCESSKFVDESGIPCDACVDEQQFYGCPCCDWNPMADDDSYDEDDDYYWEDPMDDAYYPAI